MAVRWTSDVASVGRIPLLTRARHLFALFAVLALLVELVEWFDAGTPLWPQRVVALAALATVGVWTAVLARWQRGGPSLDLVVVAALLAAGWGLGRSGAILALMLAVLQLRALFRGRWSVVTASSGVIAAFLAVEALHRGVGRLFSLGSLTVVSACVAIVFVIRLLGELLARHDLETSWHTIITEAGVELVAATTLDRVEEIRWVARRRIAELAQGRVTAHDELTAAQRRLESEVVLAMERVRSEQRYRLLAENSRDGIYLLELEPEVAYRYLNPAGAALLGLDAAEVITDPSVDRRVVHPADHRRLARARHARGVIDDPIQIRIRTGEGGPRWVELQERVVSEGDGSRSVLGTFRDVTERRRQEEALRRTLDHEQTVARELRQVDEMKSTFLQAVSHELRTPLAAVLGAAETLDTHRDALSDHQSRLLVDVVRRQAGRLERLLADLLDVDRLTRGLVVPHRTPTALSELVRRVVITQDQSSHSVTVDGEELVIELDAPKVERIVDNLLRNAIKHTPPGSHVRCTVSSTSDGATLTVEDDGPGIPPELRDALFAPFAQGPAAGAQASPGTGIGLSLVSKLAELHGGGAYVEGRPEGGARFVVSLPGALVGTLTREAERSAAAT